MTFYADRPYRELLRDASGEELQIVGQYEAFIVMSHVAADVAAATLPPELALAPPPGTPARMHPVMYSLGKHRHVHPDGFNVYEYDYDEALVGLPHVVRRGGDGTACFYMTDVRLNNRLAEELGLVLGFPKQMATITNTDRDYQLASKSVVLLTASMCLDGTQFGPDHPNFAIIARMMLQPVISKVATQIHITRFTFDTANAFMVPARMTLDVTTDALVGLPRGAYAFDTIDKSPFDGAYLSIHSWRLSQRPSAIII